MKYATAAILSLLLVETWHAEGQAAPRAQDSPRPRVTSEEVYLGGGDDHKQERENSERLGIVGDSFIRDFGPFYILGGFLGVLYLCVVLWANRNDDGLPKENGK